MRRGSAQGRLNGSSGQISLTHMASMRTLKSGWPVYLCLLQLRLEALAVEERGLRPRRRHLRPQQARA